MIKDRDKPKPKDEIDFIVPKHFVTIAIQTTARSENNSVNLKGTKQIAEVRMSKN